MSGRRRRAFTCQRADRGGGCGRFQHGQHRFRAALEYRGAGQKHLAGRVVIGFKSETCATVDAAYAEAIGEGHKGLQSPYDAFWRARYAIVEDPDGIAVAS